MREQMKVAKEIYGPALLNEVVAVTAELVRRRDDLRSFVGRARAAVVACDAAEERWQAAGRDLPEVGPDETIGVLSGVQALADLAAETGLFDSIIEGGHWCAAPDDAEPVLSTKGGQEPQPTNGKVPVELLEEYAPEDVRGNWSSLADMVERRKVELAYLIHRLQEAYATQAVASGKLCLRLGNEWTDDLDNGLRDASGFERLVEAVGAAKLWPSVEDRDQTPEELKLFEQYMAQKRAEEATR